MFSKITKITKCVCFSCFLPNEGLCVCLQDHPEHGVLYLVRGVLNMVQDYTWEDNGDAKVKVYISALPLLAAMSQETYLYSIPKGSALSSTPYPKVARLALLHHAQR